MKRVLSWVLCVVLAALAGLAAGCSKKTHPVKVVVDPSFHAGTIERIAVFPIASALSPTADPDGLARTRFDELFRGELNKRQDYRWLGGTSVEYALDAEGLKDEAKRFVDGWRNSHQADAELLVEMGKVLQVDGVLLGVLELWQQDEAGAAYVAATVAIFDAKDGRVLFEATDEDMAKGLRSETRNVEIVTSGSRTGQRRAIESVNRDLGAIPLPDEAGAKVAQALVASIPSR